MDWKVAGAAFVSVFLAELGDKTQVMTMTLAAGDWCDFAAEFGGRVSSPTAKKFMVFQFALFHQIQVFFHMRRKTNIQNLCEILNQHPAYFFSQL